MSNTDDDFVFVTRDPRKGWTEDARFNVPVRRVPFRDRPWFYVSVMVLWPGAMFVVGVAAVKVIEFIQGGAL